MPADLGLRGVLDANAVVQGPRSKPEIDVRADVRGAGARPAGDLVVDAHAHAHVHQGMLDTDGWVSGSGVLRLDFEGKLPVQAIAAQPPNAPVQFEARLAQLDLARLAQMAKVPALLEHKTHGVIDARIVPGRDSLTLAASPSAAARSFTSRISRSISKTRRCCGRVSPANVSTSERAIGPRYSGLSTARSSLLITLPCYSVREAAPTPPTLHTTRARLRRLILSAPSLGYSQPAAQIPVGAKRRHCSVGSRRPYEPPPLPDEYAPNERKERDGPQ